MKMSDHFDPELKACDITSGLGDTKFGLVDGYGIATTKLHMEAAAHAIKQHDALVAMNAELVEALERFVRWDEMSLPERIEVGSKGQRDYLRYIAQDTLTKAKELS